MKNMSCEHILDKFPLIIYPDSQRDSYNGL